jgi:uncharacterized protein YyaL (SSP411 family)
MHTNRLIREKSPYLLQHAHNPVDWYPWGDEAFAKARNEQKPIFLSVGYSTCHWCHVMERESFENETIAALINEYFVPIKVDREERPDVDRVYMTALQAMGQNGGWPMSMFLTPELRPFYGGTYFPPESRYGRAGFPEILERVHQLWEREREKINQSAHDITLFLQEASQAPVAGDLREESLTRCFEQIRKTYDPVFGGFGKGPKFPRPSIFNFLLTYHYRTGNQEALEMTEYSLQKMVSGGMYDQIGGGFHRYSVDAEWRVPHFEKMLYDQAQLAIAYLDTHLVTRDPYYAAVANDILSYVQRDLTDPGGGFYSAEDADSRRPDDPSESGEGAFFVWTRAEIMKLLGEQTGSVFCHFYGVEEGGNAPFDPQHEFTGRNILYIAESLSDTAARFHRSEESVKEMLAAGRQKLFVARRERPRPHLDDKILTSWNGLMISAFARAHRGLRNPDHLRSAERASQFLLAHLRDSKGNLLRRYRDGEARFEGHLDDYAFLAQGLLDLYESSLQARWLRYAVELTERMVEFFWDDEHGGFYDTAGHDQTILVRLRELYDGAEPAGNSVAAMNLLRLARMTERSEWGEKAEGTLRSSARLLLEQPVAVPQLANALALQLSPSRQIVVASRTRSSADAILREIYDRYLPDSVLLFSGEGEYAISDVVPFAAALQAPEVGATAYICHDFICELPTSDPIRVGEMLEQNGRSERP